MPTVPTPRPRPGGQPRNQNARKHGLYSRFYRPRELKDLENHHGDLSQEIALIRVTIVRMVELTFAEIDPGQQLRCFMILSHLTATLSRLVKLQSVLPTSFEEDFFQAVEDARLALEAEARAKYAHLLADPVSSSGPANDLPRFEDLP